MKKKRMKYLAWLLILCLLCSILTACVGDEQRNASDQGSSSVGESLEPSGPIDPVESPTPTEDPEEGKYIRDIEATMDRQLLEIEYSDVSYDYMWSTDRRMMGARAELTGIGDAFALPLGFSEEKFFEGTLLEKTDIPLSQLVGSDLKVTPDAVQIKQLKEWWKERQKELAAMSKEERWAVYDADLRERFLRSPYYWAAFANMARVSPTLSKNNAPLLERFFRRLAEYNTPKLTDFSEEIQERLTEDEFDEMIAEILRERSTEEQYDIAEGRDIFPKIEDKETLNLILDELAVMSYGIEMWREYDQDHPGDVRYARVTEEGRWFGIEFYEMWKAMDTYGVAVMTTTHNWVTPEVQVANAALVVQEAVYQENVPDKDGKIKRQYKGYWKCFPWKNSMETNQIFAGADSEDGRLMTGNPLKPPISREDEPSPDPTQKPDPTPGPKTKTYEVTLNCVDTQNTLLWTGSLGSHKAGAILTVTAVDISGYHYVSGLPENSKYTVKAGTNVITLVYDKNSDPPGPTPTPGPDPTPTPTPNPTPDPTPSPTPTPVPPDGQGGKDSMTGSAPDGDAPMGGGDTAAGDTNKDLDYNEELKKEQENLQNNPQAEADRQQQQQQEEADRKKREEEEAVAKKKAEEEAKDKGQPAGSTTDDSNPDSSAGGTHSGNTGENSSGETTGVLNGVQTEGTTSTTDSSGNTTTTNTQVDQNTVSDGKDISEPPPDDD